MAVLLLVDSHIDDIKFLREQPAQIVADFCKLAWSFISKGANLKMYQTASQKLQMDVKQVQAGVEGLANLFIEAQKNEPHKEEFKEAVMGVGFSEALCDIIYSEFINQKNILMIGLAQVGVQHPQFKNLEWRFETQVSSKSLKKLLQPKVLLQLDLEKKGETKSCCFQSDIPNVLHMNQIINLALQDSRTQHSKRIQRAVI